MMLSQTSTLLDSTGPEWSRPESPSRACGQDRRDKTAITNSGVKARTGQVRPCNTTRAYGRGPDGQDRHDQPGRAGSDRIAWTGMRRPGVWAGPGCRTGITMPGVKRRECGRGWFSQTVPVRPNSTLGHFKHYFEVLISPIQRAF
ncbi:hypothetical protein Rs2_11338 [Raphanus sativus]|nr:hypothetical protein Rs2_11338 [Raphanus sativus]